MKNTKGQSHVFFLIAISLILLFLLVVSNSGARRKRNKVVRLKPICTETNCTQSYAKRDTGSGLWLYYDVTYPANSTPTNASSVGATWIKSERTPKEEEIETEVDEEDLTEMDQAPESDPEADALNESEYSDTDSSADSDSDSGSDSSADSFDGGGDAGGDGGGGE